MRTVSPARSSTLRSLSFSVSGSIGFTFSVSAETVLAGNKRLAPTSAATRNRPRTFNPSTVSSSARMSNRHTVALVEECRVDIGFAGVAETLVAPGGAPAVADDDASVGPIADCRDGVAAANRVGLEIVEQAPGGGRVIPGR